MRELGERDRRTSAGDRVDPQGRGEGTHTAKTSLCCRIYGGPRPGCDRGGRACRGSAGQLLARGPAAKTGSAASVSAPHVHPRCWAHWQAGLPVHSQRLPSCSGASRRPGVEQRAVSTHDRCGRCCCTGRCERRTAAGRRCAVAHGPRVARCCLRVCAAGGVHVPSPCALGIPGCRWGFWAWMAAASGVCCCKPAHGRLPGLTGPVASAVRWWGAAVQSGPRWARIAKQQISRPEAGSAAVVEAGR